MPTTISGSQNGTIGIINTFTAQASTSGTSISFSSIPSGVRRVTLMLSGVSTNGTSVPWLVQIGPSGGAETSGYLGSTSAISAATVSSQNPTAGFGINCDNSASAIINGSIVLTLLNSATNLWSAAGLFAHSDRAFTITTAGSKALAGTLSVIRLIANNGTDTFDAGTINVLYE